LASAQLAHRGHISVTVLSYTQPAPVRHGPWRLPRGCSAAASVGYTDPGVTI